MRENLSHVYSTLDGGGDSDFGVGKVLPCDCVESCQDCCEEVKEKLSKRSKSGFSRMCFVTISVLVILMSHPEGMMALSSKGEF